MSYITGGVGARHEGEAFGAPYELPNLTAYNETCAAIAMVYFFHRMFLLHGQARYVDCMERTLYNGVLAGMGIRGDRFFYPNPLEADGEYRFNADGTMERQPWFGCACCPSNLCRFIPSLGGYVYAVRSDTVYVNLFSSGSARIATAGGDISLKQATGYPWDGEVAIRVGDCPEGEVTLMVRIPSWARGEVAPGGLYRYLDDTAADYALSVNGERVDGTIRDGYAAICRKWKAGDEVRLSLGMRPRFVLASDSVEADRGRVAVERGPLVYCAEEIDNAADIAGVALDTGAKPRAEFSPGTMGGTWRVACRGTDAGGERVEVTLVPYYTWNNRGVGKMAVWLRAMESP